MVNKEAWCRYRQQKMRLAGLIREQIRIYEENVVEKIKRNGRNGGLWDNINKLRGKEVKRGKFAVFDETGGKLEEEDAKREMSRHWGEIYSCLLYTSPSPRDKRQSRMPSSA